MSKFEFHELELEGSFLIENFYEGDSRGGFAKLFEKNIYAAAGIDFSLDETFFSVSMKNVVRGLHFQLKQPQAKLVSVAAGAVWDVIVDLRPDSPTLKKWVSAELTAADHKSLYIPRGFAHGFLSLEDNTVLLYQCDGSYEKETDTGIRFDDKEIAVEWPVDLKSTIHSERDMKLMSFQDYMRHFLKV